MKCPAPSAASPDRRSYASSWSYDLRTHEPRRGSPIGIGALPPVPLLVGRHLGVAALAERLEAVQVMLAARGVAVAAAVERRFVVDLKPHERRAGLLDALAAGDASAGGGRALSAMAAHAATAVTADAGRAGVLPHVVGPPPAAALQAAEPLVAIALGGLRHRSAAGAAVAAAGPPAVAVAVGDAAKGAVERRRAVELFGGRDGGGGSAAHRLLLPPHDELAVLLARLIDAEGPRHRGLAGRNPWRNAQHVLAIRRRALHDDDARLAVRHVGHRDAEQAAAVAVAVDVAVHDLGAVRLSGEPLRAHALEQHAGHFGVALPKDAFRCDR